MRKPVQHFVKIIRQLKGPARGRPTGCRVLLLALALAGFTQVQAVSFQGRLLAGGQPANGAFDLNFVPYSEASGGTALAAVEMIPSQPVSDGYFSVDLDLDGVPDMDSDLWLEIQVRPAGQGDYTTLLPRQRLRLTPRAALASRIAVDGVDSLALVDRTIGTEDLAIGSVRNSQIAAGAVGASELAAASVGSSKLRTGAVTSDQLATDAVGPDQIANGAVGGSEIAENAVGSAEIAADAVGQSEIAAGAVGADEIAANAVDFDEISANAVTAAKIQDGVVTAAHVDRDEVQLRIASDCAGIGGGRSITRNGQMACEPDSQGIVGFGSPETWPLLVNDGLGTNTLNIGSLSDKLCFLSRVEKTDVDGTNEVGECVLVNLGTWQLQATATGDATVFCEAICLPYVEVP